MQVAQMKKLAINIMIASLIGSALIAVIAVLIGQFNDILGKALFTLLIVAIHALVSLGFLENRSKMTSSHDPQAFTNTLFVLIVCSFVTAVFGIWGLATVDVVGKLYATYFVAAFAVLHGEVLFETRGLDRKIDAITTGNYLFMSIVVAMLMPVIWIADPSDLPDFFYRLLAASAIVDATLTILAVIMHRLYLQKHPKTPSQLFVTSVVPSMVPGQAAPVTAAPSLVPKRRIHPLLLLLCVYIALQFIVPIVWWFFGMVRP